jgi:hypothetical protein
MKMKTSTQGFIFVGVKVNSWVEARKSPSLAGVPPRD